MPCIPKRGGAESFWHRASDTSVWVVLPARRGVGIGMGMGGIVAGRPAGRDTPLWMIREAS